MDNISNRNFSRTLSETSNAFRISGQRSIHTQQGELLPTTGDQSVGCVPAGRSKQFANLLQRIAPERRETARIISVAPGEDLQSVANRTGVNVAQLQAFNTGVDLKSATKLVVPNSNVRLTKWVRATSNSAEAAPATGIDKVRARKGDTIARIAAGRNLDANDVARLNGIPIDAELKAGQEIKVPSTTTAPSRRR